MRFKIVPVTVLLLAFTSINPARSETTSKAGGSEPHAHARSSVQAQTIEQLSRAVAEAWSEGKLGSLDAQRPYVGRVRIRIEHSIVDRIENRSFTRLALAERWLKSRERADGPGRNIGPLQQCAGGVCTFEQTGMLHNNMYLQKITYGVAKGKPYIKTIYLIDGD